MAYAKRGEPAVPCDEMHGLAATNDSANGTDDESREDAADGSSLRREMAHRGCVAWYESRVREDVGVVSGGLVSWPG